MYGEKETQTDKKFSMMRINNILGFKISQEVMQLYMTAFSLQVKTFYPVSFSWNIIYFATGQ